MQSDRSSAEKSWLGLLLVIVTHVSTTWAKFFIRVNIPTVEIWQQSTVAFKLLRPNDRVCAFFAELVNFFRTGGRELENFGCNTIKFTLFPPPLPSPPSRLYGYSYDSPGQFSIVLHLDSVDDDWSPLRSPWKPCDSPQNPPPSPPHR